MGLGVTALESLGHPWCLSVEGTHAHLTGLSYAWAAEGFAVRVLRGRKMRDYGELFDEVAAALQVPWYFGENGGALDECLNDLSWLPPGRGYVLIITDPKDVMRATKDGLTWFVRLLATASAEWTSPVPSESEYRHPTPFHVVLQLEKRDRRRALARWNAGGAQVAVLD